MKTFNDIQSEIDQGFNEYFDSLLDINGIPRKYFYWSEDFFRIEGELAFNYFPFSVNSKDKINELGKKYFDSEEVFFSVNRNSHRHDLLVNNFTKIFDESNKKDQSQKYEYIKEFIFWQLLIILLEKNNSQLEKSYKVRTLKQGKELNAEIYQLEEDIENFKEIIPIQWKNFLLTYVKFLTLSGSTLKNSNYSTFRSSNPTQYKAIIDSLDLIQKEKGKDNNQLREKINKLYVHKDYKSKIHFIFSKDGGAEKEELRELLDIMGNEDTEEYFRGQADAAWILNASIKREPKFLNFEAEMYYDILSLKPSAFQNDNSVYERLITMQHYELPTRLLDITRNPLVAIFFACNNWDKHFNDGLIYAFSPSSKMKFLNFEDKKLESLESIYKKQKKTDDFLSSVSYLKGVAKNQRINNQSGDFIFVGDGANILNDLNDLPHMHIVIDSKTKKALLEQLETLNIHAGSVYPDLSSMSKYISNKYKHISELKKDTIEEVLDIEEEQHKIVKSKNIPDFANFWTDDKRKEFARIINDYNLIEKEAESIVEYYLNNKEFLDYKILNALQKQPTLKEREQTREALKSLINDFVMQ